MVSEGPMAIAVRGLTRRYGSTTVLDGLDLEVATGEAVVIVGPSGSGKSTLLRLIAGLEMPDAGEIRLDGTVVSRPGWLLPPHRRGIGFVFQTAALWPHMTVAQNILFGLHGVPRSQARDRLRQVLAEMELDGLDRRYPDQLSVGQARRVALARALAPRPRYLLLDEPLTSLDPELKVHLLALIGAIAVDAQTTMVHVTHDAEEAERIGQRVLVLAGGTLKAIDA
jgi:iron(III) transport system ATP-binding protein